MAPIVKIISQAGFVYEQNNHVAYVDKEGKHSAAFHTMMDFIKECKLSYAMLHAPTIYCEIVEQMWTSGRYDSTSKTLSVSINGTSYNINGETVRAALHLPKNSTDRLPSDSEIVSMLRDMHYNGDLSCLGQILRRYMRKEWSFLCDSFIKVFSGKVSNYDAFTMSMQSMFYMLMTDDYYNIGDLVLFEIVAKLGPHEGRPNNVYFARFLMMIANHLVKNLVIAQPENKLDCWVQSKRVCGDLMRILANDQVPLSLPSLMQVPSISISPSNPQYSSFSSTAMEVVHPQLPTQAVKTRKVSKSKSKKTTSGVSQKIPVVTTTLPTEGSVKEVSGEGRGDHQRSPQNKEGEISDVQPSHPTSSQKDVVINMDSNSFLVTSSQQGATIEKSSPPRAQNKRGRDTDQTPPKTFTRRTKKRALDTHSFVQSKISDFVTVQTSSQSQLDVTPVNVESQSPPVETLSQISDFHMEDVDLLYNIPHPNSPTLFLEKLISEIGDHPSQDLLDHQSISSMTTSEVVELPNPSLFTDSLVVTVDASTANASIANSFTSSIGISHQSVSAVLSTDVLNSNQPLMNDNVASMAIPQPLIEEVPLADATQLDHLAVTRAASEEFFIVTALLGLRESEIEERLSCRQAKGEAVSEGLGISSSQAKGEFVSSILKGEGECVVSQGETLMQENRELEGNAGT